MVSISYLFCVDLHSDSFLEGNYTERNSKLEFRLCQSLGICDRRIAKTIASAQIQF
jgi:hypothetical protein